MKTAITLFRIDLFDRLLRTVAFCLKRWEWVGKVSFFSAIMILGLQSSTFLDKTTTLFNSLTSNSPTLPIVEKITNYKFYAVQDSFRQIDLTKVALLSQNEFHDALVQGMPYIIKKRSKKYLSMIINEAQKYQVDPFWALAIVWVESAFNPQAMSHLQASGLMQIMPATGQYLIGKLEAPISYENAKKAILNPRKNVQLGMYYLKYLLKKFKGNTILSTCAYNMGPAMVKRRLRKGLPVGKKNVYLDKVRLAYHALTKTFISLAPNLQHPFAQTYAIKNRTVDTHLEKIYALFPFGLSKDIASWDFKKWSTFEGTELVKIL